MRYAELRSATAERAVLLDKKRLGKNQKARLATLSGIIDSNPPATPTRPRTGLDEHGQSRADSQGNVYRLHAGKASTLRELRRANKSGRGQIQPMRSRIQRAHRKQRTGGIK